MKRYFSPSHLKATDGLLTIRVAENTGETFVTDGTEHFISNIAYYFVTFDITDLKTGGAVIGINADDMPKFRTEKGRQNWLDKVHSFALKLVA
jgi:hypothetical protein